MEAHTEWAKSIARKLARQLPPSFDLADLEQQALIGLWKATERYDAQRGVPFRSWAAIYVRGEVRMFARRRNYTEATMLPIEEDSAVEDQEEAYERRVLIEQLRPHLNRLPALERRLLELQLAGWEAPAIARRLALPAGECEEALARGVRALRSAVAGAVQEIPAPALARCDHIVTTTRDLVTVSTVRTGPSFVQVWLTRTYGPPFLLERGDRLWVRRA